MPGTSPSECTPYVPIWEKATTPPFPTKKPYEIDERFPSVRIDPPDTPWTDGYDLYIDPKLW